jgi:hypothetical protein
MEFVADFRRMKSPDLVELAILNIVQHSNVKLEHGFWVQPRLRFWFRGRFPLGQAWDDLREQFFPRH